MVDISKSRSNAARWRAQVDSHDPRVLWDMLHPDCVFESPVVHTPQRGREISFKYLESAAQVLGGSGFSYVGEWWNGNSVILEFTHELNGIKINGIDMITFDANGLITHFKVMIRPLKAVNLLHQKMGAQLESATKAEKS